MSDFKPFLIMGLLLLAIAGGYAISRAARSGRLPRAGLISAIALLAALAIIGLLGPFSLLDWVPPLALASLVLIAVIVAVRRPSRRRIGTVSVAVALTVASGLMWAGITPETWQTWREVSERYRYGSTVDELIASARADSGERRPGRDAPGSEWTADELESLTWNGAAYGNTLAVGGYVNLRSTETFQALSVALDPATDGSGGVMEFLAASGRLATSTGPSVGTSELDACARDDAICGPAVIEPDGYRAGASSFEVTAPQRLTAVLNEAYYPGWSARACDEDCVAVAVGPSNEGLVEMVLPSGDYRLSIEYRTPGRETGWLLFAAGTALCIASVATTAFVRRWSARGRRRAAP
jgi:hypothetical protein